jgi:nitrogen fixation NifU-like protein
VTSDEQHVLDHYESPHHNGIPDLDEGTVEFGTAISGACNDTVSFYVRIEEGVITGIWWQGEGCCFSQAAASMLAQYAKGRTTDEMVGFSDPEMLDLFRADVPLARFGCVLVSLEALRNLLEEC